MGSKSSTLAILARRGPLSSGEWEQLIEERVQSLAWMMRHVTLEPLRAVGCLRMGNRLKFRSMEGDNPRVVSHGGVTLSTPGMFDIQPLQSVSSLGPLRDEPKPGGDFRESAMRIWGMTRNGKWIVVRVAHELGELPHFSQSVQRAKTVTIVTCSLHELMAATRMTYRQIYFWLGREVSQWVEERRTHLREVEHLHRTISMNDQFVQEVSDMAVV